MKSVVQPDSMNGALFWLITDYEEGGMDCFGPWDTPEEAKTEQLEPMLLYPGDRWFIVTPVERGDIRAE